MVVLDIKIGIRSTLKSGNCLPPYISMTTLNVYGGNKMKKKLLLIMLLLGALLVSAINYTSQTPANGSHINGNSSTFFGITGDENLTTGFVFFNGSSIGAANCSGLNCNGTFNLVGFPDGNYTWY